MFLLLCPGLRHYTLGGRDDQEEIPDKQGSELPAAFPRTTKRAVYNRSRFLPARVYVVADTRIWFAIAK